MTTSLHQQLYNRKRRINRRLAPRNFFDQGTPVFTAGNIHYDMSDRILAVACGGIGAIHLLARHSGLIEAINADLKLLKVHLPYHESDHVLNIAYNLLAGGTCIEDLELLRNNEVYLNALGATRIPDPTTAGDFCRRFTEADVQTLMDVINRVRVKLWKQQSAGFFELAIVDADGAIAPTQGECKQGMGLSYDGQWSYHALVMSLANTGEPLFLVNRSGNRPSHEGAGEYFDRSIILLRLAGFLRILLRGDTDFSQTKRLDGWDNDHVDFLFGFDATPNLKAIANGLPPDIWRPLNRPARYEVKTDPRQRPENVKERLVVEHEYKNIRLKSEDVAEFDYTPTACKKSYRMVVVRKNLSIEKGEKLLFDDVRYFFYITNVRDKSAEEIVLLATDRCNQENLNAQLKGGVKAMKMPAGDLTSNWAYMVMASLAWTLKAWMGLSVPVVPGPHRERHEEQKRSILRMEFRQFVNALVNVPCQIVRQAGKIIYRLLSWNPWQQVLVRVAVSLRPLRC